MRTKMPGLDPFYVGWRAFEHGGISAVESIEAPIIMHAVDQIDPELADKLALKYADQGLRADDLRFGMWPDASPVQQRSNGEPVGVHLNTFGIRQVRYGEATEPERAALEVITFEAEELVRDAINPEYGAGIFQFGKIPTMHRHIVARETRGDGLGNWLERSLIDVNTRREMRDRLASAATPERLAAIAANVGKTLSRYAV